MAQLRVVPCTRGRASEVVAMLAGPAVDDLARARMRAGFESSYFDSPWADPDIPSLLCEDDRGRVLGFVGVVPRPMLLDGKPLRAAVSSQLLVRPDEHGRRLPTVAIRLLKALFAGNQDLTFTDGANDRARRVWEGCGGASVPLYSLDWLLPLRPSGLLLALGMARGSNGSPAHLRALGQVADLLGSRPMRRLLLGGRDRTGSEPFAAEAALGLLGRSSAGLRLRAAYDEAALGWLRHAARREARPGTFRDRLVTDARGRRIGWFAYSQRRAGVAEVVQLVADGQLGPVLGALIDDAAVRGHCLLRGVVDARDLQAYRDRRCVLTTGRWMLVHSRDRALIELYRRGDVVCNGYDGERWMTRYGSST